MATPAERLQPADDAFLVRVKRRQKWSEHRRKYDHQHHRCEDQGYRVVPQPIEDRLPIAAHLRCRQRLLCEEWLGLLLVNIATAAEAGIQGSHRGPTAPDSRCRGNYGEVVCHARRILGSISDCSRSTIKLVATKTNDRVRIVPCNTGTSRLMIALLNRKPLPGQVNTVSTRIEPPSR